MCQMWNNFTTCAVVKHIIIKLLPIVWIYIRNTRETQGIEELRWLTTQFDGHEECIKVAYENKQDYKITWLNKLLVKRTFKLLLHDHHFDAKDTRNLDLRNWTFFRSSKDSKNSGDLMIQMDLRNLKDSKDQMNVNDPRNLKDSMNSKDTKTSKPKESRNSKHCEKTSKIILV